MMGVVVPRSEFFFFDAPAIAVPDNASPRRYGAKVRRQLHERPGQSPKLNGGSSGTYVFRAGNLLPPCVPFGPITGVVRAIIIAPGLQKAAKQVAILIWLGARVRTAGTRTGAAGRAGSARSASETERL